MLLSLTNTGTFHPFLPGIEGTAVGVILDGTFLHDEAHALEEGGGDSGRLFAQEDVDGVD